MITRRFLALLIGTFVINSVVQGAVPNMINYQGIVQVQGTAFSGTGSFKFAIVDHPTTPSKCYWTNDGSAGDQYEPETAVSIPVQNGLFDVRLGETPMVPLTSDLFDYEHQYLRIWFSDGTHGFQHLTPDQHLTTVAFSHKAGLAEYASDAAQVDGVNASELEESPEIDADITAHTALPSAHHTKTTSFKELADTATDAQIPDDITVNYAASAGNAGTLDSLDSSQFLRSDSSDSYTSGTLTFGSTTNQTFNSMPAFNGGTSGSSAPFGVDSTYLVTNLNADKLDGQDASEIINAAKSEVRAAISSVPITINSSGSYYLTQNLSIASVTSAITVNADNVTLDLNGFTLTGNGSTGSYGIYISSQTGVSVLNGTLSTFDRGIYDYDGVCHQIRNVHVVNNVNHGIYLNGYGHIVDHCSATSNGTAGINVSNGCVVTRCIAYGNTGDGIYIHTGCSVIACIARENTSDGISANSGCTISESTCTGNTMDGIHVQYGCTISGNSCFSNTGDGISTIHGGSILNNSVHDNGEYGINLTRDSLVDGNTAYQNNSSAGAFTNMDACASCTFGLNHAP